MTVQDIPQEHVNALLAGMDEEIKEPVESLNIDNILSVAQVLYDTLAEDNNFRNIYIKSKITVKEIDLFLRDIREDITIGMLDEQAVKVKYNMDQLIELANIALAKANEELPEIMQDRYVFSFDCVYQANIFAASKWTIVKSSK
jgi:hypothetical protein